jgi:carboxylesterase
LRAALAELAVPVLVAYSPQDHSVPPENSKQLLAMLPGPKEELKLERSFHVATLDYDFDLLVDSITAFADSSARV